MYNASFVLDVFFCLYPSMILIWWYILFRLIFEKFFVPHKLFIKSSTLGNGNSYHIMFNSLLVVHNCIFPYFFGTIMARIVHGIILSLIKTFQNKYATCLFNSRFSSGLISSVAWFYQVSHGNKSISCILPLWWKPFLFS